MADSKDERPGFVDRAKDAVGGMVGRMTAKTIGSQSSAAFIENAAISDMYEIEAATIALERARSPRVKDTARTLLADHMTSSHHLGSALLMNETRGEGAFPTAIDDRRSQMLDRLRAISDDQFDRTYLDQQVMAHKETVDLMTGYRDRGPNPQLRSLAAATAPVMVRHLGHIESLRKELPA